MQELVDKGAMEEARLLDSLQRRLGDLEHKVQAFRHDMVVDFQHYYHDQLRDVPPAVAANIRQSLGQSLAAYPSLSQDINLDLPDLPDPQLADSRAVAHPESGQRHHSPPMSVFATGFGATESLRSPHEHENDFRGLFTPSYLPLLEGSPEPPKPLTVAPPPPPTLMHLPEPGIASIGQGAEMDQRVDSPSPQGLLSVMAQSPSRPGHVRRSTDDTASSVVSDRSDTKIPRSALRRSSSNSRPPQSPRRVRFEFRGAEVLPTASPQSADFVTPRPLSPDLEADAVDSRSLLDDEEEELPPPRKISSSEALRALSRAPLDEGTVWTVVNSNPDEILVEQQDASPIESDSSPSNHLHLLPIAPDPPTPTSRVIPIQTSSPRRIVEEPEGEEQVDYDDDSSDEEFLSMAKPKSFANKKAPNSPSLIQPTTYDASSTKSPTSGKSPASKGDTQDRGQTSSGEVDVEEEDMFHFETGLSAPPKPRTDPKPYVQEDDDDEDIPTEEVSSTEQALYATSPAVAIARPPRASGPTTPTSAKFPIGSLGSYKGRPVVMPVVLNPDLHAQAAELGQFNTFVGGLDGRSGMDEGDLNSFRASFADSTFTGAPRSFTERLMMEDSQMRRNNNPGPPR